MAKYGRTASKRVESAMRRRKKGTLRSGSGRAVRSRKQAIAIGLSEAREEGGKVPARGAKKRQTTKRGAKKRTTKKSTGKTTARKPTTKRGASRKRAKSAKSRKQSTRTPSSGARRSRKRKSSRRA